jgi:hypothetical protein
MLAADPRIDHYWNLTAEITASPEPTPGAIHDWLCAALDDQIAHQAG